MSSDRTVSVDLPRMRITLDKVGKTLTLIKQGNTGISTMLLSESEVLEIEKFLHASKGEKIQPDTL